MPDQPKRYLCRHIHASGLRCGSPCLRGEHFCYYHHTSRRPAPLRPHPTPENFIPHDAAFLLSSLEDRPAIQLAISEVARQVAANQIDHGRARLLLYAFRAASINLPPHARPTRPKAEPDRYDGTYECETYPAAGSSTSESSDAGSLPANPMDSLTTPIEEIEVDPTLGPLAPIAELLPPEEEEPSITPYERYLEDMRRARPACPHCNPAPDPKVETTLTLQATAEIPTNADKPLPSARQAGSSRQARYPGIIPTLHGVAVPRTPYDNRKSTRKTPQFAFYSLQSPHGNHPPAKRSH